MTEPNVVLERLTNLTFALKDASDNHTWRSGEWIRTHVHGYGHLTEQSFKTTFRKDRQTLKLVGVPVAAQPIPGSTEQQYQLANDKYGLEQVEFTAEEAAVIALTTTLGLSAQLGSFAQSAWTKIAASGARNNTTTQPAALAHGDLGHVSATTVENISRAIASKSRITFTYQAHPAAPSTQRDMDPWALVPLRQRVYLLGFDNDRAEPRSFRITRISNITLGGARTATHQAPTDTTPARLVMDSLIALRSIVDATIAGPAAAVAACANALGDRPTTNQHPTTKTLRAVDREALIAALAAHAPAVRLTHATHASPTPTPTTKTTSTPSTTSTPTDLTDDITSEIVARIRSARHHAHTTLKDHIPPFSPAEQPTATSTEKKTTFSTARLADIVRMLNLIPYFSRRPGASIMMAAAELGLSPREILNDLNRLWCCGLPGLGPGDLVELEHDYSSVTVHDAKGMTTALRLTRLEASTLLLALETLESMPELTDPQAVASAADKLRALMPNRLPVADIMAEDFAHDVPTTITDPLRDAIRSQLMVHVDYRNAAGATTSRTIAPTRIFAVGPTSYLSAWDPHAGDGGQGATRTFRLDRMLTCDITDTPAPHTPRNAGTFNAADPFGFDEHGETIELALRADKAWLADLVPMTFSPGTFDGPGLDAGHWIKATMNVVDHDWLDDFLISYGDAVYVSRRKDIAQRVADRCTDALSAYHEHVDLSDNHPGPGKTTQGTA
ncbi:helix-turn-helix transcriptional regulator [Corynebacterium aquilae]|uniref:helix-turn-helix transcriptional regulator n=1 Tax=Corynebacterium aquilae TaxID=203263 RepID=UPI0009510329|nr:WYL domain-containing protein [Corynebacterium aquilae]